MNGEIRRLTIDDYAYVDMMETGIEDDYVKRLYERLIVGNNRLYGLFINDRLACMAGFSIFAGQYAMLGRLRSGIHFRGKDYATRLTAYITDEAFSMPNIEWVGANTQEKNTPARRVLSKLGFAEQAALIGATAKNLSSLEAGNPLWDELHDLKRKKEWLNTLYVRSGAVFPYECYYNFPASEALFTEDKLSGWTFYENQSASRVLITKSDVKKHTYLHAIYPWNDYENQKGLWETIAAAHREAAAKSDEETYIWLDIPKENIAALPDHHPFTAPSPWILYGLTKDQRQAERKKHEKISN